MPRLGEMIGSPLVLGPSPILRFDACVLAAAAAALLLWAAYLSPDPDRTALSLTFGAAGVLAGALAGGTLFRRAAQRFTLALYEQGITVERFHRRMVFLFERLQEISVSERDLTAPQTGVFRRLRLRSPEGQVFLENAVDNLQEDRLGAFLIDVLARMADEAERRMRSGEGFAGGRWVVDPRGFRTSPGAAPVPYPEIAKVALFEGRISLWREKEERPFFSVPMTSPNALVLRELLWRRIEERPLPVSPEGLGRLLFEKKGLWSRFRAYELGVEKSSPLGTLRLRLSQIERVTYGESVNDGKLHLGTFTTLKLQPEKKKAIKVSTLRRRPDSDLAWLRDIVAQRIAETLARRLEEGEEIDWTGRAKLSRQGVRVRGMRWAGQPREIALLFSEEFVSSLGAGFFRVYRPGEKTPLFEISRQGEDFYPGLLLFERLVAEKSPRPVVHHHPWW